MPTLAALKHARGSLNLRNLQRDFYLASVMSAVAYFAIVGALDNPLYETDFGMGAKQTQSEHRHLDQFIVHAALDNVEEAMWETNSMFLKVIDKFNDWYVSAFRAASGASFLLLHKSTNLEAIRQFFFDVHEIYIKALLNPFYERNQRLSSTVFDAKVKLASKRLAS